MAREKVTEIRHTRHGTEIVTYKRRRSSGLLASRSMVENGAKLGTTAVVLVTVERVLRAF